MFSALKEKVCWSTGLCALPRSDGLPDNPMLILASRCPRFLRRQITLVSALTQRPSSLSWRQTAAAAASSQPVEAAESPPVTETHTTETSTSSSGNPAGGAESRGSAGGGMFSKLRKRVNDVQTGLSALSSSQQVGQAGYRLAQPQRHCSRISRKASGMLTLVRLRCQPGRRSRCTRA